VRSPIFNVKRPEDKTDEEIVVDIEKKVVQMIGNFTHKEWECAQRILKHQGRVNRVLDEMGVTYSPRLVPPTAGKKMQPPGNIGSEPAKTSRKGKSSKAAVTTEGAPKSTKAQDVLAKQKADAAKATMPPLAEKSSKLLKINENLARRKTEAAKVAAAEREKKKILESSPLLILRKRWFQRRGLQVPQKRKSVLSLKKRGPTTMSPQGKRRGSIRSRRQTRMLIYCRRLRFSLPHFILRRGLCKKRLKNCQQQLWPIRRNWRHVTPGANAWLK
jgi:hypothetical protein